MNRKCIKVVKTNKNEDKGIRHTFVKRELNYKLDFIMTDSNINFQRIVD